MCTHLLKIVCHRSGFRFDAGTIGQVPIPSQAGSIELSPDDQRIAMDTNLLQDANVWVIDSRGVPQAISNSPTFEAYPIWNPTGSHITYVARKGALTPSVYQKASNAVGMEEAVFASAGGTYPRDWSPDGTTLVFEQLKVGDPNSADLWTLSKDKVPRVFLEASSREVQAQISPDGKYIAYATNSSGRYQIVVRSFPNPDLENFTITVDGGVEPRWRRNDGTELFYLSLDGKMMAVEMQRRPALVPGTPKLLFTAPPLFAQPTPNLRRYDVSADGQRFLFSAVVAPASADAASQPIITIVNWARALKKD